MTDANTVSQLPTDALHQAADTHGMPGAENASKADIAAWLVANKPDEADQLVKDNQDSGQS